MSSAFESLCGPGKPLKAEPPDANEFAGLKRSGLARLKGAGIPTLSLESRFDLGYNAAHALCSAVLRWHGYRSSNRCIVFQLLPHTLELGPEVWRVLSKCHDLRNLGEYEGDLNPDERDDFWATTSNKELNFVEHIKTLLKPHGHAAVVVPDNVLFEGGAGETIRRKLLHECDVHTLLRLPTGLFYAQGLKANVIFFDRKPASETPWTRKLWIYDLRTNRHFTLKTNPLKRADLDEFVALYQPANRHRRQATWSAGSPDGRWRVYEYDALVARDKGSLDIFWLKDESLADSDNLPPPEVIAREIVDDLEAALEQFRLIAGDLGGQA